MFNFVVALFEKMSDELARSPSEPSAHVSALEQRAYIKIETFRGKSVPEIGWETLPHSAYSPDMSPPDYDLFLKLKEPLRRIRFPTLNDLSTAVSRRIRQLNSEGVLTGITDLPDRWKACIEKKGDYIEGL